MLGPANGRKLQQRRRNDVHLHRAQDECGFAARYTEFCQLHCQHLLNRQEQRRGAVSFVRDPQNMLSLNQCLALRAGK
ncbi:hypothetical protein AWC32_10925 [Mycobacterium xenopi]|nr:hypothetical protein AWC32_10925 [Mycobacterium xenopi]